MLPPGGNHIPVSGSVGPARDGRSAVPAARERTPEIVGLLSVGDVARTTFPVPVGVPRPRLTSASAGVLRVQAVPSETRKPSAACVSAAMAVRSASSGWASVMP